MKTRKSLIFILIIFLIVAVGSTYWSNVVQKDHLDRVGKSIGEEQDGGVTPVLEIVASDLGQISRGQAMSLASDRAGLK